MRNVSNGHIRMFNSTQKKPPHLETASYSNGGPGRNWTNDTRIFSPLLYRLSYGTIWLRGKDLNQRPPGYEPDELPGCSTPRCLMSDSVFTYLNNVMAEELGFEPRRQFPDLPVFKTGPFNHLGIPPKYSFILVDPVGLEPTTDRLWAGCSNQLS